MKKIGSHRSSVAQVNSFLSSIGSKPKPVKVPAGVRHYGPFLGQIKELLAKGYKHMEIAEFIRTCGHGSPRLLSTPHCPRAQWGAAIMIGHALNFKG